MEFPISQQPAFSRTLAKAKALAAGDHPITIYGETGTGKEHLATALHYAGPRAGEPFVAVNMEAIAEGVTESELFGHEKGAFTDAVTSSPGACGRAGKGTLFIDEFHRIPVDMRDKLLRLTAEKTYRPMGAVKEKKCEARLIFAMNKHPMKLLKDKTLSEDMYYRLGGFPIGIPPLRKRRDDILPIVLAYLEKKGQSDVRLDEEDAAFLLTHEFRGNIRDLLNIIDRALFFPCGDTISLKKAHEEMVTPQEWEEEDDEIQRNTENPIRRRNCSRVCILDGLPYDTLRALSDANYIRQALEQSNGNVTKAAQRLGISREALRLKMKEYNITKLPPK